MNSANIAITGIGCVSGLGLSAGQTWEGLCAGKSAAAAITAFDPVGFDCKIAGQVGEYKIRKYVPKSYRKATKLMCRDIELSVIAAYEAIADSGYVTKAIDPDNINFNPERTAIAMGAGLISCDLEEIAPAVAASLSDGQFDIHKWGKDGLDMITPLWMLKYLPNMLACHIGIIHDIQGPSNTITCAEASGQLAIAEAAEIIFRGESDMAVAGGGESKLNPIVMARQCLLGRATTEGNDDPESACRPFDSEAKGSVFGEGAGIVFLEKSEIARKRGAKIYAEIAGLGQSNNINTDYIHLESEGTGLRIAVEDALEDAGISPEQIDLIIPHGLGLAQDDLAESRGIAAALTDAVAEIPVLPTKSMITNTGAASGAIDVAIGSMIMDQGLIPAAKNCEQKIPGCALNINTESKETQVNYVLCCNYSYGGQTAAIILKRPGVE